MHKTRGQLTQRKPQQKNRIQPGKVQVLPILPKKEVLPIAPATQERLVATPV